MGWLTSKQLVEGLLFSRPAAFRIFVNHFQSFESFGLLTVTFGVLKIVVGCSKVTVGCLRLVGFPFIPSRLSLRVYNMHK